MYLKLLSSGKGSYFALIFTFTLLLISTKTQAQCAGQDASVTVCDIPNVSSQAINLYSLLGGTPTPGGTWTDDDLSGGINLTTGILNAQVINQSGTYHYTYTVTGVPGCVDTEAVITVIIGGYSGVTGPNAVACSDGGSFNLFHVFSGSALSPQSGGSWYNNTHAVPVAGNSVDLGSLGLGTFQFTYTINAIDTCPAQSSTAFLTVYRAPEAGTPGTLLLCNTDDLSLYSNLDLNSLLTAEDANGQWTEGATDEITTVNDHNINVQNIYNTLGSGTYNFTYTVLPTNPICDVATSVVTIIIEEQLDLTGATLSVNSDICENEIATATYSATITQGAQNIPNGSYNITYQVTGPNGATNTVTANFNAGVLTFPLSSGFFQQIGSYTVSILNFTVLGSQGACQNIINNLIDTLTVSPNPVMNNTMLTLSPVCEGSSALAVLSGMSSLPDGSYTITYNLSGSNSATGQTSVINVVGGVSDFTIPAGLIPNPGNTTVTITSIVNNATTCSSSTILSGTLVINPLPVVSSISATINDVCENQPVTVLLSGLGSLTNIIITYNLTGANTATNQTITLPVTAGTANFVLPALLVPNSGSTVFAITYLINTGNLCGNVVNNVSDNFDIIVRPNNPAASDVSFCKTDNATVANLLPSGSQYQWFDSPTSTTPLNAGFVLISGNYYVNETNSTTGCVSTKTMVIVTINEVQTPTLNTSGENFCGLDNPTLQELSANVSFGDTLIWFDAASGGNQLPNTTLLLEGVTYYGFDFFNTTNCFSEIGLPVTVSLTDCDAPNPEITYDFFIPDGFSPNGDGTNDTFTIPNIQFIFPNYTLEIYNRYGSLMFKGDKNKPNWDGKSNESASLIDGIASNGVYFYVINFNKDNKSPKQGRLYLNR